MLASRQIEDLFIAGQDKDVLKQSIMSLCSSSISNEATNTIIDQMRNMHLYNLSEAECFKILSDTLPECSVSTAIDILKVAPTIFSPVHVEKLFAKACDKKKVKYELLDYLMLKKSGPCSEGDITASISSTTDLSKLSLHLRNCLMGPTQQYSNTVLKKISSSLTLNENKSKFSKFIYDFCLLARKSNALVVVLENFVKESESPLVFEMIILLVIFNEPTQRCWDIWTQVLSKMTTNAVKTTLTAGNLLAKIDSSLATKIKFYLISLVESMPYNEQFALFLSVLLASSKSVSRSEVISELLILATESENVKYITYLNALLDVPSDTVTLSLNDFKTVLDFVEFVPSTMIFDFYTVMVKIALKMSKIRPSDQVMNELGLIVRKQLASPNEQVCINGVAGALALCTAQVPKTVDLFEFDLASCSQAAAKEDGEYVDRKMAKEFIQLAYTSSLRFLTSAKFFHDNAAKSVENDQLDVDLLEILNEKLAEDFQANFVTDSEADIPEDAEIKFNLMEDAEIVVVRIYPVITDPNMAAQSATLTEHVRLMGMIEKKLNKGSLENVDNILKFALVLPAKSVDSQLGFISHLVAYNYIRELVNQFNDQPDSSIRESCRKRLLHIRELEEEIKEQMGKISSFTGLKSTSCGIMVSPASINVVQRTCKARSAPGNEIVIKACAYSHDRIKEAGDNRTSIKLKTEEDLFKVTNPLNRKVLSLLGESLDVDGKGKDDLALSEDQFIALLDELRIQLVSGQVPLEGIIECFDGALSTFSNHRSELSIDSDLIVQFPRFILDVASTLKSKGRLTEMRANLIRNIFADDPDEIIVDVSYLKLMVLLADNRRQEQEIVEKLTEYIAKSAITNEIVEIISLVKAYPLSFKKLYTTLLEKISGSKGSSIVTKCLFSLLLGEVKKSQSLTVDIWAMQQLENLAQHAKNNYSVEICEVFLKNSKEAIDLIANLVMPRFERELLSKKDEVLATLKKFQQYTRTVQTLCNHIKSVKDKSLLKHVPQLKRVLEVALLRVKQMLQANNCHGAFWVGNLKHKGLDGKEVESHIPLKREEADEDEDEHVDEEIDEENEDDVMETADKRTNDDPTLGLSL